MGRRGRADGSCDASCDAGNDGHAAGDEVAFKGPQAPAGLKLESRAQGPYFRYTSLPCGSCPRLASLIPAAARWWDAVWARGAWRLIRPYGSAGRVGGIHGYMYGRRAAQGARAAEPPRPHRVPLAGTSLPPCGGRDRSLCAVGAPTLDPL